MQLLSPQEYSLFDAFCQKCSANFMQSPRWGQVKKNWYQDILVLRDTEGNLCAGIQLLYRKSPLGYMLYAPRGPVFSRRDPVLIRQLLADIQTYARKKRLCFAGLILIFPQKILFCKNCCWKQVFD